MNWKQKDIHPEPPLSGDYLIAESCNGEYTYNVYQYDWDQNTWFCDGVSVDAPVAWTEFDPYEKLSITKFH